MLLYFKTLLWSAAPASERASAYDMPPMPPLITWLLAPLALILIDAAVYADERR